MSFTRARHIIGGVMLLLSLAILVWTAWPASTERRSVFISPADIRIPGVVLSQIGENGASIFEGWILLLEWPSRLRVGEVGDIRLILRSGNPEEGGAMLENKEGLNNESAAASEQTVNFLLLAESRLEMGGVQYKPSGVITQAISPGKPVDFLWSVRAPQAGDYQGMLWLYLRFVPQGDGLEARSIVSAQRIEIKATTFFGLAAPTARIAVGLGMAVGVALIVDVLLARVMNQSGKKGF